MSVVQGSTLSCLLYLIFILDLPLLYHTLWPNVKQQEECNNPTPTTFVDDTVITLELTDTKTNQTDLEKCFYRTQEYMTANWLHLNQDKTTLVVVSKHPDRRNQLYLPTNKKTVYPVKHHKYLGISVSDDLKWNNHITDTKDSLTKQLKTRLNALRKVCPYIDEKLIKQITNEIFASKLGYGLELWAGTPIYLRKKVQTLQLQACIITLGPKSLRWSTSKLLSEMKWNFINSLLEIASSRLTHSIINKDKLENLSYRIKSNFKPNPPDTRTTGQGRLGTIPNNTGRTQVTKNHFRVNIYKIYSKMPQVIMDLKDPLKF